ncbi:MAG TPA: type I-E CRISPR-associated protein Cse2/CasB [Anaeromyxobacter sp.]|nr:type I-E CRISPR-associated protein Cse2/CasB [Anaeromyxobacter sp.]
MRELIDAFVTHLEGLARRDDRGALAKLRRGLGRPPGTTVDALPYVVPFLPQDEKGARTFFLVAGLFGLHPELGGRGNFGAVFGQLGEHESAQRRFVALLDSHEDELPEHLRRAVTLARSKNVAVEYRKLLRDLTYWSHPHRFVQLEWARAYWGHPDQSSEPGPEQLSTSTRVKE